MDIKQFVFRHPNVAVTSLLISLASAAYVLEKGLNPESTVTAFFYAAIFAMTAYTVWTVIGSDEVTERFLVSSNLFLWFSASFLASRFFVRVAGIGNPQSPTGSLGLIPLNQIWIADYHIHHYFLGLGLIVLSNFVLMHRGERSRIRAEVLFGSGLGLLFDEIGFLLSMGNYSSFATYPLTLAMAVLMFAHTHISR